MFLGNEPFVESGLLLASIVKVIALASILSALVLKF